MTSFLCPNGTLFNQQFFVCDWWFNVDCSKSVALFPLNQRLASSRSSSSQPESHASSRSERLLHLDNPQQTTTPSFARFERHPQTAHHFGPSFDQWTSRHIPDSSFLDPYSTLGPGLQLTATGPEVNSNAPEYRDQVSSSAPEYQADAISSSPNWGTTTAANTVVDTDYRVSSNSPYYEQDQWVTETPKIRQSRNRFPSFFNDSPFHTGGSFYSSWPDPEAAFLAQHPTTPASLSTTELSGQTLEYIDSVLVDPTSTSSGRPVTELTTPHLNLLSSTLSVDTPQSQVTTPTTAQYASASSTGLDVPKNWILIAKNPDMLQSFLESTTKYGIKPTAPSTAIAASNNYAPSVSTDPAPAVAASVNSYAPEPVVVTASPQAVKLDNLHELVKSSAQVYGATDFQSSATLGFQQDAQGQDFIPYSPIPGQTSSGQSLLPTSTYALINNQATQQTSLQSYNAPQSVIRNPPQTSNAFKASKPMPTHAHSKPVQTNNLRTPVQTYNSPTPQTFTTLKPITVSYGAPSQTYGGPRPTPNYGSSGPTIAFGGPNPIQTIGSSRPLQSYSAPKPTKGYGAPKPTKGYGAPKAAKGYGVPKPTKGYGTPKAAKGYGVPKAAKGYGVPKPSQTYGLPKATKAYGAPIPTKAYGAPQPTATYNVPYVSRPNAGFSLPPRPANQGSVIRLQLASKSPPVHAVLQTSPPSAITQKPVWNQPYNQPIQRLSTQSKPISSFPSYGSTTSQPSDPFRAVEAVSFTSDSIPFRPSNLMASKGSTTSGPQYSSVQPAESYRNGRSRDIQQVVRGYPVPRSDSEQPDHSSFVVQPDFPFDFRLKRSMAA